MDDRPKNALVELQENLETIASEVDTPSGDCEDLIEVWGILSAMNIYVTEFSSTGGGTARDVEAAFALEPDSEDYEELLEEFMDNNYHFDGECFVSYDDIDDFSHAVNNYLEPVKDFVMKAVVANGVEEASGLIDQADSFRDLSSVVNSFVSRHELNRHVKQDSSPYTELYGDAIDIESIGQSTPERKRKM